MEAIGWLGSFFLAICGLPLAIQAYKDGHCRHMNMYMVHLWFWGEVLILTYVLGQTTMQWPLIVNYTFNVVLGLVVLRYRYWPTK